VEIPVIGFGLFCGKSGHGNGRKSMTGIFDLGKRRAVRERLV
jgi:hypothetical protein